MLAHRLQRWPNINPTFVYRLASPCGRSVRHAIVLHDTPSSSLWGAYCYLQSHLRAQSLHPSTFSRWTTDIHTLTFSSLNLPLSSSSTTSRELLSQFSTCSGWIWLEVGEKVKKIAFSAIFLMDIFLLRHLIFSKIKSVFRYGKWCFNASWGFKRLNLNLLVKLICGIRCNSDGIQKIVPTL